MTAGPQPGEVWRSLQQPQRTVLVTDVSEPHIANGRVGYRGLTDAAGRPVNRSNAVLACNWHAAYTLDPAPPPTIDPRRLTGRHRIEGTIWRRSSPLTAKGENCGLLMGMLLTREEQVKAKLRYPDLVILQAPFAAVPRCDDGTEGEPWDIPHQYRRRGTWPPEIYHAPAGSHVTLTAHLKPFSNGLGHYLTRLADIEITPPKEEQHWT